MSKRMSQRLDALEKAAKDEAAKDETPKAVEPLKMGDFVKATENSEIVFVGMIADVHEGNVRVWHAVDSSRWTNADNCTLLSADEFDRYHAVAQQTTLGMGNIIDAVING